MEQAESILRRINALEAKVARLERIETPTYAPKCRAYTASFSHNSSANWLAVALDAESFDTTGMHSTVTNNSRITIAKAGKYLITGGINFAANATGVRYIGINNNGSGIITANSLAVSASYPSNLAVAVMYTLAVNDYIELYAWQSSGGTLTLSGNLEVALIA